LFTDSCCRSRWWVGVNLRAYVSNGHSDSLTYKRCYHVLASPWIRTRSTGLHTVQAFAFATQTLPCGPSFASRRRCLSPGLCCLPKYLKCSLRFTQNGGRTYRRTEPWRPSLFSLRPFTCGLYFPSKAGFAAWCQVEPP
jgi:hypothetical protein